MERCQRSGGKRPDNYLLGELGDALCLIAMALGPNPGDRREIEMNPVSTMLVRSEASGWGRCPRLEDFFHRGRQLRHLSACEMCCPRAADECGLRGWR